MIWQFSFSGSDVRHYLMGTMHLASREAFTFADTALSLLKECHVFAAEMDIHQLESAQMDYTLPEGLTLSQLLGEKKYAKIGRVLHRSFGIAWPSYDKSLPFFISSMLSIKCANVSFPYTLDQYLWRAAKAGSMSLFGLESIENQKEVLHAIPLSFQLKELQTIARNVGAFRHRTHVLQQLYARNDVHLLYQQTRKYTGAIRKCMLHERNERMGNEILRLSSSNAMFVAVGASHLGGDIGLLAFLKKRGAKVVQLT